MSEMWRAIPGYEGMYEVSDMGRVRSLERFPSGSRSCRMCRREEKALRTQAARKAA